MTRLDPARREEDTEQQHIRQEEAGVIKYETISRATPREQTYNNLPLSIGDSNVANQVSKNMLLALAMMP